MPRTVQGCPGDVPCQLQVGTSHTVEYPQRVSHTPTHGTNYQRPPPNLVDGVEEYKVKKVLDSRWHGRGRKLQYLIAWKGYPDSDNQWVNWDDMEGAEEAIREFKRLNSNCEIHIKASINSPCSAPSHSRISSMTTSPSSTVHWTIDTPKNCAAWDAIVRSDSYHAPAVTYGDNNNVDDATAYNDYQRGSVMTYDVSI
jgi:hypothetical protein